MRSRSPSTRSDAARRTVAGALCAAPLLAGCVPDRDGARKPPTQVSAAAPTAVASSIPPAAPQPVQARQGRGGFLKGQLHLHSNHSGDSDTSPERVADWYAERGFDFIVFTDHNRVTDVPGPDGMLVLRGVELTQNLPTCEPPPGPGLACLLHVDALLVEPRAEPVRFEEPHPASRLDLYARALDAGRALGGVLQLNHPNFHFAADAGLVRELAGRGVVLLEIANMAVDSQNEGDATHPSTEVLWDAALAAGVRVFGTATDDAHHYDDALAVRARGGTAYVGNRGWVMVRATADEASIRRALVAGDFYATTGLALERVALTPERLDLAAEADAGDVAWEIVGRGGRVVRRATGPTLAVDPRALKDAGPLRVRATDSRGRRAWMQPVWLDAR